MDRTRGRYAQLAFLLDAGIEAVIELAGGEPLAVLPRELVRCRFPLDDGDDNPPWLVRLAVESVACTLSGWHPYAGMLRRRNEPIRVRCGRRISTGRRRGHCGKLLPEVAGSGPADVSPALLVQVQAILTAP